MRFHHPPPVSEELLIDSVLSTMSPSTQKSESSPLDIAIRRHPLVTEVAHALDGSCNVPADASVLVGVSGGPDSIALLLAMHAIAQRRIGDAGRVAVTAAHINHNLRDEASEDEAFVCQLCEYLGVSCKVIHVHPSNDSGSLAASARSLRYAALSDAARTCGAEYVAVAHHAEDQLETMLMGLCRGAGLTGLSGMSWRRDLLTSDDTEYTRIQLIRPLLAQRKADCEAFCQQARVAWRIDPTNANLDQPRARLRHEVLPILEELWPDASRRASATAADVSQADRMVDVLAQHIFGHVQQRAWDRSLLSKQPPIIIGAGLRRAAFHAVPETADQLGRVNLDAAIEAILSSDTSPKEFHWPGSLTVRITSRLVELTETS